jgi:hypothetical protein
MPDRAVDIPALRQKASAARAAAQRMEEGESRDIYLKIAATYDRLADDEERIIALHQSIPKPNGT